MTRVLWGHICLSLLRAASTLATLLTTSKMWASHKSVLSTWTPRHLQLLTLSIECPSRYMCSSLGSKEIFSLVPVNRHLVLRTFRLRRLESSHCFRLPKSLVRDENNSSESLEANVRFVSLFLLFFSSLDNNFILIGHCKQWEQTWRAHGVLKIERHV